MRCKNIQLLITPQRHGAGSPGRAGEGRPGPPPRPARGLLRKGHPPLRGKKKQPNKRIRPRSLKRYRESASVPQRRRLLAPGRAAGTPACAACQAAEPEPRTQQRRADRNLLGNSPLLAPEPGGAATLAPPAALPPPGPAPAAAPGLFGLQPRHRGQLNPITACISSSSRDSIALPVGAPPADKRAGGFLTEFREGEGAAPPLLPPPEETSRVRRSLPGTRAELTPRLRQPRRGGWWGQGTRSTVRVLDQAGGSEPGEERTVASHKNMLKKPQTEPPTDSSVPMNTVQAIKQQEEPSPRMAPFRDNSAPEDCVPSASPQLGHPAEAKKRQRAIPALIPGTNTFIKNYCYVHRKRKQEPSFAGRSLCATALGLIRLKWLKLLGKKSG